MEELEIEENEVLQTDEEMDVENLENLEDDSCSDDLVNRDLPKRILACTSKNSLNSLETISRQVLMEVSSHPVTSGLSNSYGWSR
jgi:hypothetical protein